MILAREPFTLLVIYEATIATTQILEQVLLACDGICVISKLASTLTAEDITPGVLPLFVRCADPALSHWPSFLANNGRPYAYYIDDDFWHLDRSTPLGRYYGHPSVRSCLNAFLEKAGYVLTNTRYLAETIYVLNANVSVLPTHFDFSLLKGVQPEPTHELRIGFAGTATRLDDLRILAETIEPTLRAHPDVVFEFAGVLPESVRASDRIRYFPYLDNYEDYIRFAASRNWAVGLAPLRDTVSNRAKTDAKYREYAALGIAGIYSDIPPYCHVVENFVTGILVDDSINNWRSALEAYLGDRNMLNRVRKAAFEDARRRYELSGAAGVWSEKLYAISAETREDRNRALDDLPVLRSRLAAPGRSLWVRVAMAYQEGGVLNVVRRALGRLARDVRRLMSWHRTA